MNNILLGHKYKEVEDYVKSSEDVQSATEGFTSDSKYYISASMKTEYMSLTIFYFNVFKSEQSICYKQNWFINKSYINRTVSKFNNELVTISELKWKDYARNRIVSIDLIDQNTFCVEIEALSVV